MHCKAVVWRYEWQEDSGSSFVMSDSDWGEVQRPQIDVGGSLDVGETRDKDVAVHAGSVCA